MRILKALQLDEITDAVRAKFSMAAPVLEATLYSLSISRAERFGGYDKVTLEDLAREFREGFGDAGICFEHAVHTAIAGESPLIYPITSEVLEQHCGIKQGAQSLLFGPEKEGRIPILESIEHALTDESRVYVGNRGHPPKLKKYVPQLVRAYHKHDEREKLPRSIVGLWKADLFLGNNTVDKWVGTTVKINPTQLQAAPGLRIGLYPKQNQKDTPRFDDALNLVRLPLPYNGAFMEAFYKAFYLIRAFLKADAMVPPEINLPDAEDRYITSELQIRRQYPAVQVLAVLRDMAQPGLLREEELQSLPATATLSLEHGLERALPLPFPVSELVSIAPEAVENT